MLAGRSTLYRGQVRGEACTTSKSGLKGPEAEERWALPSSPLFIYTWTCKSLFPRLRDLASRPPLVHATPWDRVCLNPVDMMEVEAEGRFRDPAYASSRNPASIFFLACVSVLCPSSLGEQNYTNIYTDNANATSG